MSWGRYVNQFVFVYPVAFNLLCAASRCTAVRIARSGTAWITWLAAAIARIFAAAGLAATALAVHAVTEPAEETARAM